MQVLQLERANQSTSKELSDIKTELELQQGKLRQQTKELKDAVTSRKLTMDEFTELNDKVNSIACAVDLELSFHWHIANNGNATRWISHGLYLYWKLYPLNMVWYIDVTFYLVYCKSYGKF